MVPLSAFSLSECRYVLGYQRLLKETQVKANPNRTRMEANHKKQVFKLTNGKSKGKLADHSSKSRLEKLIPSRVPYPKPWLEILIRRPAKLFWLEESVSLPKYQLSFRLSALFLLKEVDINTLKTEIGFMLDAKLKFIFKHLKMYNWVINTFSPSL